MKNRARMAIITLFVVLLTGQGIEAFAAKAEGAVLVGGGGFDGSFLFGARGDTGGSKTGGSEGSHHNSVIWDNRVCVIESKPPDETGLVLYQYVCINPDDTITRSGFFSREPGTPAPPDVGALAQQAMNAIDFAEPVPQLGPDIQIAVNRWNYLSVDDPGTLTATATIPGLSVTATATLTSTSWSMGEISAPGSRARVAAFECSGSGTKPGANSNTYVSEPTDPGSCAYSYSFRSLSERTGGTGTWPVTVATTWSVSWTATNGVSGTAIRTQMSAPRAVRVGEWRSDLVAAAAG